jgi:hypothetical protein
MTTLNSKEEGLINPLTCTQKTTTESLPSKVVFDDEEDKETSEDLPLANIHEDNEDNSGSDKYDLVVPRSDHNEDNSRFEENSQLQETNLNPCNNEEL